MSLIQLEQALQPLRIPLTAVYLLALALLATYGLHRYFLTMLFYRTRRYLPRRGRFTDLPPVTVQLPLFNEQHVAERIIEEACKLDYPADKLQIQVLDDSTDESAEIARRCAERMREQGHDVQYLHRTDRKGFKAGALREALPHAKGQFIVVFDADFLPPHGFIKRTVHHFTDPKVGTVQTCWDHINRCDSVLTRCQAIFLDSHFLIEQTARNRSGRWMNFNGTAGIWRREAIETAGGWEHDTLTEDVDLSYRAQLAGWKFVYLPRVQCPAELPPEIGAYKSQQHRWTKGSMQCALKLLPRIWKSPIPWPLKLEASLHLTSPLAYLCMVVIMLLFFPALFVNLAPLKEHTVAGTLWGIGLFLVTTCSAATFFVCSQTVRRRSWWRALAEVPFLMAIGLGMALSNSRAVVEAIMGKQSDFIRTPKFRATGSDNSWRDRVSSVKLPPKKIVIALELLMAAYLTFCCFIASLRLESLVVTLPFLILFASGYWYVGLHSLASELGWQRDDPGQPGGTTPTAPLEPAAQQ